MKNLSIDPALLETTIQATGEGLMMTGIEPTPIGASSRVNSVRGVTVLIGFNGERNGSMALSMSPWTACFLATRFLGDEFDSINEDVLDAVCELGNMVAGRHKDLLKDTPFAFSDISLPSLVFGDSYKLFNYRGITSVTIELEIEEVPLVHTDNKFFSSSISFVGASGR